MGVAATEVKVVGQSVARLCKEIFLRPRHEDDQLEPVVARQRRNRRERERLAALDGANDQARAPGRFGGRRVRAPSEDPDRLVDKPRPLVRLEMDAVKQPRRFLAFDWSPELARRDRSIIGLDGDDVVRSHYLSIRAPTTSRAGAR